MKYRLFITLPLFAFASLLYAEVAPAPNGIKLPANYKDWRIISTSHREDNHSLRVIIGNNAAIHAARTGQTNPWPDGAIIGKLVWKDTTLPSWKKATVSGEFAHSEFMIKNSKKFQETGGWGYARWLGMKQQPYGKDASFVQECTGCHAQVKDSDSVFTVPAKLP